jgi:hypothetical protein
MVLCWRYGNAKGCIRLAQGLVLSLLLFAALLFARGELGPFLDSIVLNFAYSQGSLVKGHGLTGHLLSHLSLINFHRAKLIAAAICACLLYAGFKTAKAGSDPLLVTALASFCASVVVLATTGLWRQHLQLLAMPAILAISAVLASGLKNPLPMRLAAVFVLSWILSGGANPARYGEAAGQLAGNWRS